MSTTSDIVRSIGRPRKPGRAVCHICNQPFDVRSISEAKKRRYCSRACTGEAKRRAAALVVHVPYSEFRWKTKPNGLNIPVASKLCGWCKEIFWTRRFARNRFSYCSDECVDKARQARKKTFNCTFCGREKTVYRREGGDGIGTFCSRLCVRKHLSKANHPRWVRKRVATCLQCTEEFPRYKENTQGIQSTSERKFCSRDCRLLYRRLNPYPQDAQVGDLFQQRSGYISVKTIEYGWIPQHRWVVEQHLGRPLTSDEHIHHRNGIKSDNRIENLQVVTASEHIKLHKVAEKIGLAFLSGQSELAWLHPLEGMGL